MKYRVYGVVTGSKYLGEYEADSPEEAGEMALDEAGFICLCHSCSPQCEDPVVEVAEIREVEE